MIYPWFSNVQEDQFPYSFTQSYYETWILANLLDEKWPLNVLLVCISLIKNKIEHLFISVNCLFIPFAHFSTGLLVFSYFTELFIF